MPTIPLVYSDQLVRRAVMSFVWRAVGREAIAGALLATGLAGYWLSGQRGWAFGFICGIAAVALVLPILVFSVHYRQSMGKFRAMRNPQATLRYDEQSLTLASDLGSATLPWSAVRQIWRFDQYWLLLLSRSQFITLPVADLDATTRERIVARVAKVQ